MNLAGGVDKGWGGGGLAGGIVGAKEGKLMSKSFLHFQHISFPTVPL